MQRRWILMALIGLAGCTPVGARSPAAPAEATVRLGETAVLGWYRATVVELVEDSRCPLGVQCVHAGTVRVDARLANRDRDDLRRLTLGAPAQLGDATVALVAACPQPVQGRALRAEQYRFTLVLLPQGGPPLAVEPRGC